MRRIITTFVFLFFITSLSTVYATASSSADTALFDELMQESGLQFVPPKDFSDIAPNKNSVLSYERALRHQSGQVEMRLVIRPLSRLTIDYDDPHNASPEPNHLFPLLFESMVNELSIAGGDTHNSEYPAPEAKKIFNAGWASAAVFDVNPNFTGTYSQALLIAIHKHELADAYTLFLYNDSDQAKKLIKGALNSLSFKP